MTSNKRKKISIIGAGFVGSTCAHWAAAKELGDVVLIDINEKIAQGKALDLFEASPVEGFDSYISGSNNYEATKNSDVVIVTAGTPRKPGMSRDDLLKTNTQIMKSVCEEIKKYAPNSIVIIVSNPLDAMAYVAKKVLGFKKNQVIGMAGVLDTARFKAFLAEATKTSVKDIQAFVLGGHGDTMVPMTRFCSIGGLPLEHFLSSEEIKKIVERTRKGGAEIVGLLKTGSAYYAPSASAVQMAESILKDQNRILPAAVFLEGEYGISGLYVGVLCQIGANGVKKVLQIDLTEDEQGQLKNSAQAVQSLVDSIHAFEGSL